jgi:competence CoiA-like predicted nuclease
MQFALDENLKRITPSFSGQKANCPLCKGPVVAKCGEIYVKHWSHIKDRICDTWKEHETPWHREWKGKFPKEWQEVIIEENNQKHIADIKTSCGTVIEFQNSPISKEIISVREAFYDDMIWVVNAIKIEDHFKKWSVVRKYINNIDRDIYYKEKELTDGLRKENETLETEYKSLERKIKNKFQEVNETKDLLEKLEALSGQNEKFISGQIENIEKGINNWDFQSNEISNKLNDSLIYELKKILNEINDNEGKIREDERVIKFFQDLETFQFGSKEFKIVPFERIHKDIFLHVIAITKESRNQLFPIVKQIKSVSEFQSFAYKHDRFDFGIDHEFIISTISLRIQKAMELKDNYNLSLLNLKRLIGEDLTRALNERIGELKSNFELLQNKWEDLIEDQIQLQSQKYIEEAMNAEIFKQAITTHEKTMNEKKSKIMIEKKGLYEYEWRRERKSWANSNCPVYFDFGDGFLFERINDRYLRKVEKKDFISRLLVNSG